MSQQQAPQTHQEETAEAARHRRANRRKKRELTAADFAPGEQLRVMLKFHDGRVLGMAATVVDVVHGKVDGKVFDHVVVQLGEIMSASERDLAMANFVRCHLFLLDYSRSNYWFWRIHTVRLVED